MTKSIIPIGKVLGARFDESGLYEATEWLRGDDSIDLTADEAMTLAFAYEPGHHRTHFERRFDRDTYLALLQEKSDHGNRSLLEPMVDDLIAKGLLVEIDLGSSSIEGLFRAHRIIPTATSFGNTAEDPELFHIGHAEPELSFSGWVRDIWAYSHTDGSIWRGCELLAEAVSVAPMEAAEEFAGMLPVIAAASFGFLEKIDEGLWPRARVKADREGQREL